MTAVYRKELLIYFTSPIVYAYLLVFYFFSGLGFNAICIAQQTNNLTGAIDYMFTISMFILPVLTMRLFGEERKNKTDILLYTSPAGTFGIVAGKLLAAATVYGVASAIFVVYAFVIGLFTAVQWAVFFCGLLGFLLMGVSLIAIGGFISVLTENQIVAAVITFAISLLLSLMDYIASMVSGIAKTVLEYLSYNTHFTPFQTGQIGLSHIIFFLSVTGLFAFFTARSIDHRRFSA
ncbi:MAG: ABC transporter permease [Oscillospiraceae bacterium]|jgi:ABC-2 type transport system permease protein|nr:ABC transporter permease [Oscillospiraceae bacterium]